ncbi:hypothetical protein RI103_21300 [Paraburkholderia sp. FT54]|uniref:hypothetical protein n=1 Tax=Paraburkholderia sp. FT54 TaxID=3074437 RepID=UPI002877BD52|nr:hypothetical protein [Paraburkholderia sp. FT54]WNC93345.1 hypothetical protein RI103_21300 [Paraburkholderia sp. FT54]
MKTKHNYHDAELVGCAYSRTDSALLLSFECTDGTTPKLLFSGVTSMRANDFSQQNVVSRLLISPTYEFTPVESRAYVNWANSRHDYQAAMTDEKARTIAADIATNRSVLFVLEPSVGAEVVALCTGMQEID